jgi:hypothetical protein
VDRIVATSAGSAWIIFEPHGALGFQVGIHRHDEQGWVINRRLWLRGWSRRRALPAFFARELGLPADEAAALAHEAVDEWPSEWKARGGESDHYKLPERLLGCALVFGIAATLIVFAVLGVVLSFQIFA